MNKPNDVTLKSVVPEGKLPSTNYWSEDHFKDELEYVFRRGWLNVCRADQLPNPGDFFVKDLYALGVSALIVRGQDGQIRAFYNMCSHRGNKVACDREGNRKGFQCLFHGWVYDTEGKLVSVPEKEKFEFLDMEQESLRPINMDIWGGFVHICLDDNPPSPCRNSCSR